VKIFFLLLSFSLFITSKVQAECILFDPSSKIESLKIEIKNKNFYTDIGKRLINSNKNKNYVAQNKWRDGEILVNYKNNKNCILQAKIRPHGDTSWHTTVIDGFPISSMRVDVKDQDNINNIKRFILFIPKGRNGDNEVFVTTLLSELGYLAPRTFKVKLHINDKEYDFIFQEDLQKEFLEFNKKNEGPIIESNEDFSNYSLLQMSRISNHTWMKDDIYKTLKSLEAISKYNYLLLSSYPSRITKGIDDTLTINKFALSGNEYKEISTFDAFIYALGAGHGLSFDDRRFYYDTIYSSLIPVYYDGKSDILSVVGYDKIKDIYTKNLDQRLLIQPLFLNQELSVGRTQRDNLRNPIPTYIAKIGSETAIDDLKKINKKKLLKNLQQNGLININEKDLNKLIEEILKRLTELKNSSITDPNLNYEGNVYENFSKYMKIKNLSLIFLENIYYKKEDLVFDIEICNYDLKQCEKQIISTMEIHKYLKQDFAKEKFNIFVGMSKNTYIGGTRNNLTQNYLLNEFKDLEINNDIKLMLSTDLKYDFDSKKNQLVFEYESSSARAIIYKSNLNNLNIVMKNNKKNDSRDNQYSHGITGCLTIIDSKLTDVSITAKDFNCEDTVNFIRSSGTIKKTTIQDSKFDAIDADFSNLFFQQNFISNAQNDCLDLSFGVYEIENLQVENCGDKGISAGENSKVKINNVSIKNTNVGVAVKDQTEAYINNTNMSNIKEACLTAYKKKQEFYGGIITYKDIKCNNAKIVFKLDKYSKILQENKYQKLNDF
jgi:hypothetical protein